MLDIAAKQALIKEYQVHEKDNGSTEVQIALLTHEILGLTEHLKVNRKDFHSRRGLIKMVSQRKKLLRYLKTTNLESFQTLVTKLNLRA
jgi:small subunit ribosomal protein S15